MQRQKERGLKIINLENMNKALLTKWWWILVYNQKNWLIRYSKINMDHRGEYVHGNTKISQIYRQYGEDWPKIEEIL